MKWATRITGSPDCARQPLDQLLTGQLDGRAGERLAAHLDACETCQQRLTQLAAAPSWWFDASRWLEPDAPGDDSCFDDLNGCEIDEFDANPAHERDLLASGLLEESTNPAMLGALGRYEVKRVIGAGGTGVVLQATDTELGRTVAIKVLAPTLAAHGPARKRFARESQAVAAVAHENVVTVHHVEGSGRVPYLVMQYIDGDSLQERVIRDGPLDVTTTLRMTAQLAAALAAAHDQGLVHRDVKPANILVGPAGQRVWMTDFGLARAVDDASLTRTGFIAGTPHYMSPEQARGATVRTSSDLFGLGGVVYFMLTGRPPFRADRTLAILNRICTEPHRPVREVNPQVPPEVAALVDRLLAKSTADRFSDAEAVRAECLRLLANLTSPDELDDVEIDTDRTVVLPQRRRISMVQAVGAVIAVALLAGCLAMIIDLAGQLKTRNVVVADDGESPAIRAADELQPAPLQPVPLPPPQFANGQPGEDSWQALAPAAAFQPAGTSAHTSELAPTAGDEGHETSIPSATPTRAPRTSWTKNSPGTSQIEPLDPTAPASFAADVNTSAGSLDASAIWQLNMQQVVNAVQHFESEVAFSDDGQPEANVPPDAFDEMIRWMEATADRLQATPAASAQGAPNSSDILPSLPTTTTSY